MSAGGITGKFHRDANGDLNRLDACAQAEIPEGHTIVSYSCGGGGYGDPYKRPVDKVSFDVREKWVSIEAAQKIYGVVVDAAGVVDQAATEKLRAGPPS